MVLHTRYKHTSLHKQCSAFELGSWNLELGEPREPLKFETRLFWNQTDFLLPFLLPLDL